MIALIISSCTSKKENLFSEINSDWRFKNAKDTIWLPATVPGTVHTDLLDNKKIAHPFIGNNEDSLQWISKEDWHYQTTFTLSQEQLKRKHHYLYFDGLDTYAKVILNDSVLLETNNAFRNWEIDVSSSLKQTNHIQILFSSTTALEKKAAAKLAYELPVSERVFTRKAQFHYGWDWGPTFITSGVWRPIRLVSWNEFQLKDIYIKQNSLDDQKASLQAEITFINTEKEAKATMEVLVNDTVAFSKEIQPKVGKDVYTADFEINNPKRWWTHNLGTPYLYNIEVRIKHREKIIASRIIKKGLRTIQLITDKDEKGATFHFELNGTPVFMKGANYIPQHIFQPEVTDDKYQKIFKDAIDANMNMLRVWGGGIYENDIFYDLADEKGMLVWQDFMFACAMYPGDTDFLENVRQEAIDNVTRLRNHASIALWCGNNENNEAWHNWGWQEDRSDEEKSEIWGNYQKLFNGVLPETVAKLTNTSYWESSPSYGRRDPRFRLEGNAHDWAVWHGGDPFERFEEKVPRFMSEYGFQSFPSYEAIRYFTQQDSIDINHASFKTHQKHDRGFAIIREYMGRDFPVPEQGDDYVYVSQLLQAYGMVIGIEAHRRAKPYNMGTLYWQLNDCWPVVSWAGIDGLGNWKALHYKAKKSFEDVLISPKVVNDTLRVFAINDLLKSPKGNLKLEVKDFKGNIIWEQNESILLKPNSSEIVFEKAMSDFSTPKNEMVLTTYFLNNQSNSYFVKPKDLKLSISDITKKVTKVDAGYEIRLSSKDLQKDLFLYTKAKGHFSDNFFDLLPNVEQVILLETTETISETDIDFKTLNQLMK